MSSARRHSAISVENLSKTFYGRGNVPLRAIDNVSFDVLAGTTLGLVGESGSGKSTVARCLLGLVPADSGRVHVLGREVTAAHGRELRDWRRDMQIVFQDSRASLDPRQRVSSAIAEPLLLHTDLRGGALDARVDELLSLVRLRREYSERFPHELSGGEQQRVSIARALATHPKVLVLDEPTSSLDVSVRADILKLLVRLQRELDLTYILISHDLPTIRNVCDRVGVMYLGRLVEIGPAQLVLSEAAHPYTDFLLGSELSLDPDVKARAANVCAVAVPNELGPGCIFVHRCPLRTDTCYKAQPPLLPPDNRHRAACIWVGSARAGGRRRVPLAHEGTE